MEQILYREINAEDINILLDQHGSKKVFLVTGKESYRLTGANKLIESVRLGSTRKIVHFFDFSVNPKFEEVLIGVKKFETAGCDFVIGIGGGSVIDMAKLINSLQANSHHELHKVIEANLINKEGVPLLAIPTTAGSGSEATHFAVIYIDKKKYSLAHKSILPRYIGLNYKFIISQNPYQRACSGLDALSQAIEAFWSVNSTEESDLYAEKAISYMYNNLSDISNVNNPKCLMEICEGAYLAGKAINITKTTGPHALSYSITSKFNIPHGHAVFLTLPNFIIYNYNVSDLDINDTRGKEYLKNKIVRLCNILGQKNIYETREKLMQLANNLGVQLSIKNLGISKTDIEYNLDVNLERMNNNPRKINNSDLIKFFNF